MRHRWRSLSHRRQHRRRRHDHRPLMAGRRFGFPRTRRAAATKTMYPVPGRGDQGASTNGYLATACRHGDGSGRGPASLRHRPPELMAPAIWLAPEGFVPQQGDVVTWCPKR
jgi:hypothetical protein